MSAYEIHVKELEAIAQQEALSHLTYLREKMLAYIEELEDTISDRDFTNELYVTILRKSLRYMRHYLEDLEEEIEATKRGMR